VTELIYMVKVTASMMSGIYQESLLIPIKILITNTGAPKFKETIADITVKVNEIASPKFPNIYDPDPEDNYSVVSENFGAASMFVTGKFPNYKISPTNNSTQRG
jgi:hypothetical protein